MISRHFIRSHSRYDSRYDSRFGSTTILLVTAVSCLVGCSSQPKNQDQPPASTQAQTPAAAAPQGDWAGKMQSLSGTLSDLLPMVASKSKFNTPANFEKIEADTRNLRQLAHSLSNSKKPNSDPSLKVMSGLFAEDIERALDGLRSGNRAYARQILKDTTSYCIQCHTQSNFGPNFPKLNLNINTAELTKIEQAEFFTATRQFDRALESYVSALKDEQLASADPFAWEQSARSALAIIARVKNDPKEAKSLLSQIESQKSLPESTRKSIGSWKKSIQDWSAEKKPKSTKAGDKLKRAEALIAQAQKNQEFPLDHSQDIVYFRAASLLHEFLQNHSANDSQEAKALYLAGTASEATRDMNFWTLHESYYEQCIRALPHSKQAEQCYEKLKDSITLGYSGSGGINIPTDVNQRLQGFREAAQVTKQTH